MTRMLICYYLMNPNVYFTCVCKPTMTHIELIGRSYVGMENAFSEIYYELKVLDMKAKDGFIKTRRKEKEGEVVIHGGIQ